MKKLSAVVFIKLSLIGIIFLSLGCSNSNKEESEEKPLEVLEVHEAKPKHVDFSLEHLTADITNGKVLYKICEACHGSKAEGMVALNAPNLSNQDDWYLERQLNNFKTGIRGADEKDVNGTQMAAMAKTLSSDQAIKDVVAYIKTLPEVQMKNTIKGDFQNGKEYYNMICSACHSGGGIGNKALNSPSLNGIDDWYLLDQLKSFQSGRRGSHPSDKYGDQMKSIADAVPTEDAFQNVVHYISNLEDEDSQ